MRVPAVGASAGECFRAVYVINLARRPDRWAALQGRLAAARITGAERVEAVEGAAAAVGHLRRHGALSALAARRLRHARHPVWGMDLTPGAVGCALSHALVWARVAAAAAEGGAGAGDGELPALVLEDDACFPPTLLAEYCRRAAAAPPDCELLYLGGLDTAGQCTGDEMRADRPATSELPNSSSLSSSNTESRPSAGVWRVPQYHRTTSAYAVTPRGAARLLDTCLPLTFQVDTVMTMRAAPYVRVPACYTLQPPLATQADDLGTDIQLART